MISGTGNSCSLPECVCQWCHATEACPRSGSCVTSCVGATAVCDEKPEKEEGCRAAVPQWQDAPKQVAASLQTPRVKRFTGKYNIKANATTKETAISV